MNIHSTGALILSAGHSSRMKTPKALLPFNAHQNFLDKLLSTYVSWGCDEIVVVVNALLSQKYICPPDLEGKVTFVLNGHLEYERFYSVQLGLQKMMKSEFCFLQNVDNPFISNDILDIIHLNRSTAEWVSPRFKGKGGHPVLLNSQAMNYILGFPEHDAKLNELLESLPCRQVEMPDDRVLININEVQELEKYRNNMSA